MQTSARICHLIAAEVIELVSTCNEPMFHAMRPKTPQHLGSAKTRAQRRPATFSQRVDSVNFSWALLPFVKTVIVLMMGNFGKETYQTNEKGHWGRPKKKQVPCG